MLLAWVLVIELAAAGPIESGRNGFARAPQLVAPGRGAPRQTVRSLAVGGRTVWLRGLGEPATDRLLSRVASNIGAAIAAVESFWGADWAHDISVVAAGSDREFRAAAGGGPASQWADIAAVTVVDRVDPARRVAIGQRIVFAPGAAAMSTAVLRIVLTHELFHYAARVDTAPDAPRWLTEGVADYVARLNTPLRTDARSTADALPLDADLELPGPRRSLGYDRAWWFARFVADTYGRASLRALYLAACGIGHPDFRAAAHDMLDSDAAGLLVRWQRWMVR